MKIPLAFLAALMLAMPAWAQQVDGEVRRVDKEAKKITLRHGPIPNLDMPAHSMVLQVRDPAMFERVKVGDKVKFEVQKVDGAFVLVSIEKAQ